jgi:hypothetical protein
MKMSICRIASVAALLVAASATVPAHATTYVSFSGHTVDHIDWVNLPYGSPISGSFSMPDEIIWDPSITPYVPLFPDVTSFSVGGSLLTSFSGATATIYGFGPEVLGSPPQPYYPVDVKFGGGAPDPDLGIPGVPVLYTAIELYFPSVSFSFEETAPGSNLFRLFDFNFSNDIAQAGITFATYTDSETIVAAIDQIQFGSAPNPTPLPATLPLLSSGLGILGIAGCWRRRKRIRRMPAAA